MIISFFNKINMNFGQSNFNKNDFGESLDGGDDQNMNH